MNICYWNINKNTARQSDEFNECLLNLLNLRSVDLFCISEFDQFDDDILLNNNYELVDKAYCDKVKFYKKKNLSFTLIRIGDRYAFVEYKENHLLFVCLHAYDARNHKENKRLICMEEIKREIDNYISENGETRVLIFGDFNCMPYADSIVNFDVLNCVLFRDLLDTKKGAKERYYNPMLLIMSEKEKIYGSIYVDSTPDNLMWYLLDQVIVNKESDKIMNYESIELIRNVNGKTLLKNSKPNKKLYSDHLPLYFEINEEK